MAAATGIVRPLVTIALLGALATTPGTAVFVNLGTWTGRLASVLLHSFEIHQPPTSPTAPSTP